jgi:hypothetical protein
LSTCRVQKTLLEYLGHFLSILSVDIDTAEQRTRMRDVADPTYPTLARQLLSRPDNPNVTIAALRQRLEASQPVSEEHIATYGHHSIR